MISYAGVSLRHDNLADWIAAHQSPAWAEDAEPPDVRTRTLFLSGPRRPRHKGPLEINVLRMPWSACNFGIGHFLADDASLNAIRNVVNTPAGGVIAAPFVMSDGANTMTTNLYMLPARPLTGVPGGGRLWLISLVDSRYYWWMTASAIAITPGTTTWATLFAAIATALGETITVDPIPSVYLKPPADLASSYDALPQILDAAASSIGMRVVRNLNGTYRVMSTATAKSTVQGNRRNNWLIRSGGQLSLTSQPPSDLNLAVPASITTVLPKVADGVPSAAPTTITNTLASLALADYGNQAGFAQGDLVLFSTEVSSYTSGSPNNAAETTALALQISTDWYEWWPGTLDISYNGLFPWSPEGQHDVEWRHQGEVGNWTTRVRRGPWREDLKELYHYGAYGSVSPPIIPPGTTIIDPTLVNPTLTNPIDTGTPVDTATSPITLSTSTNSLTVTQWQPVISLNPTVPVTVRSLVPPTQPTPTSSQSLTTALRNDGAAPVTLPHEDPSGTSGGQFSWPWGLPSILFPGFQIGLRQKQGTPNYWVPTTQTTSPLLDQTVTAGNVVVPAIGATVNVPVLDATSRRLNETVVVQTADGTTDVLFGTVASVTSSTEFVLKLTAILAGSVSDTLSAGAQVFPSANANAPTSAAVTSVAISGPSIITWANSPVTSTGTLTGSLATQTASKFLRGPAWGASAAAPTFGYIASADLVQATANNDGSIPFMGTGGYLTQDSPGNFVWDAAGTGPLGLPETLYLGDVYAETNTAVLAMYDAQEGGYGSFLVVDGTWFLSSPGSPAGTGDGALVLSSISGLLDLEIDAVGSNTGAADALIMTASPTSGTPGAGFGSSVVTTAQSSVGSQRDQAAVTTTWTTATDTSRKAKQVYQVYDTLARTCLTLAATGSAGAIGFLAAAASPALVNPDLGTFATTFGLATGTPSLDVAGGGTGGTGFTAYGLLCGGLTSTGGFQSAGTGTAGQIYFSAGSASLGAWTGGTNGQILIGNGTGFTVATLTQGTGITITNSSGAITIAATGSFTPATADLLAQTTALSSVLAVTSPNDGNKHQYRIGMYANITAVTGYSLAAAVSFTDENGAPQQIAPAPFSPIGINYTGFVSGYDITIRVSPNTAVTIITILIGTGTIAYDVGGSITQVN